MLAIVADELVVLCPCWDLAEAQAIRASLAARGVRVLIDGEHQRGILGMMGAAVTLRVMVPRSQLALARELASEIIPDLASHEVLDDDEALLAQPSSPARRALPDPIEVVDRVDEDDEDEDEEGDVDERDELKPKSLAVALVVAALGFAVGTLHMYAGESRTGFGLLGLAGVALVLILLGNPMGNVVLLIVWAVDVGRGIVLIRRHNAKLDEAARVRRLARMN